jgi:citrate lyase beta subunit
VALMRSVLTTPATSDELLQKASRSAADVVMVDLEDSVSPAGKVEARARAVRALREEGWGRIMRTCRINGLDTPWGLEDLIALAEQASDHLDAVVVPKVRDHHDVIACARILRSRSGTDDEVALHVLVEDARAYAHLREIVERSAVRSVVFGAGDFTASLGIGADALGFGDAVRGAGGSYPAIRANIAVIAKGFGCTAIDTPYPDFRNPDGYRAEAIWASRAGFDGKWCIHPSQIPIANEVFSPSRTQFEMARDLIEAYDAFTREGQGAAFVWDGKMIDEATARIARETHEKGRLIGLDR